MKGIPIGVRVLIAFLAGAAGAPTGSAAPAGPLTGDSRQYVYLPPADVDLSDTKVLIWQIPAGGGVVPDPGDWSKVVLGVAPANAITGSIRAKEIKARAFILIGATFAFQGDRTAVTPAGHALPGGDVLSISFAAGAPKRPFLWVSNIQFNAAQSYWGDFLRTGTALNASKNNFDPDWMDVYFQRSVIKRGHYFFTTPVGGQESHSDVFQSALGGWHALYASHLDITWQGQQFFIVPTLVTNKTSHPDAQAHFDTIMSRPMPGSALVSGRLHGTRYIQANRGVLATGDYVAVDIRHYYGEKDSERADPKDYFGFIPGTDASVDRDRLSFARFQAPNRNAPHVGGDGCVVFAKPLVQVVNESETGAGRRVATAAELRAVLRR